MFFIRAIVLINSHEREVKYILSCVQDEGFVIFINSRNLF